MTRKVVTPEDACVLVVEDDENNRLVAIKLLEVAGILAENIFAVPGDPVPYMRETTPDGVDLILLDLQLPDKDGFEIIKELRADVKFATIPVVAMTANVMQKDVDRVQAAGFDGFIGKPINGPRFSSWVKRILAGEVMWRAV